MTTTATTTDYTQPMMLDCGHMSTPSEYTAGYARTPDERRICYSCADASEREALKTAERFTGYFVVPEWGTKDGKLWHTITGSTITTWSGGLLARVTYFSRGRHNFGGFLYRFRAIDVHGGRWYGTSPGPGMYARMRRAKGNR